MSVPFIDAAHRMRASRPSAACARLDEARKVVSVTMPSFGDSRRWLHSEGRSSNLKLCLSGRFIDDGYRLSCVGFAPDGRHPRPSGSLPHAPKCKLRWSKAERGGATRKA